MRPDLACGERGLAGRDVDDAERNVRAEQIGDHRTGALVGHQRDLQPGRMIEQRRGEMHDRAAVSDRELGIAALLCVDDVSQRLEPANSPAAPSMNG